VYYPAAGAMRVNGTLYYMLKDHLGSASVVTDSTGAVVGEQRYYPFGETRLTTGTMYTDKLFTGQREITGLGIYHYQSRFYSPKLGRFLSADTIVPNPANPQAFNRYAYVLNNPTRYVDPTGHVCSDPEDETPTCYGSSRVLTRVGNRMIRGNDAELRASRITRPNRSTTTTTTTPTVAPSTTLEPTSTPCSVVLIACSFPSSPTPVPTITETPYDGPVYVVGPTSTSSLTSTSSPTSSVTTTPWVFTPTLSSTPGPPSATASATLSVTPSATTIPSPTPTLAPSMIPLEGRHDCVFEDNCEEYLGPFVPPDGFNPFQPRPLLPGVGGPPEHNY